MKVEHQIRAFEQLLNSYDGVLPMHRHLVGYFKQNKQMGSSDRRWATRYIYSFFRLGKALNELATLQRLAIADFLCNDTPSLICAHYLPEMQEFVALPVADKINEVQKKYKKFDIKAIFPFDVPFSETIDLSAFYPSFFVQPDLFIRVQPSKLPTIMEQLNAQQVVFQQINEHTLALLNGTKLAQVLKDDGLYQIQDLSSQHTGTYFEPKKYDYWWDCCAASGGKSLLLHSLEPNIELVVSDVRAKSLTNLQERFQLAGIKKYQLKVIDLLQNNDQILHHYAFDGILVDAPCSGSGTWGRTPEMLCFFEKYKVENYVKLQKAIAGNVAKYLKSGKPLIYMTCSVFKAENEDIVAYLTQNFDLKLEKMELIKGYSQKADSMFVARLIKN